MGSVSQKNDPAAARGDCASVSLLTTFFSEFRAVVKSFGQLLANGSQQHSRRHAIEPPRFLNRAVARSRRQILFGFSERSLAASSFGSALLSLQENNTFSRQMWASEKRVVRRTETNVSPKQSSSKAWWKLLDKASKDEALQAFRACGESKGLTMTAKKIASRVTSVQTTGIHWRADPSSGTQRCSRVHWVHRQKGQNNLIAKQLSWSLF